MSKFSVAANNKSRNEKVKKIFPINISTENIILLASSMAHEFKNYLTAISICAELSEQRLKAIRQKVTAADYLINNLQLQIKGIVTGELPNQNFKAYSIAQNIKEILVQYPFTNRERKLINVNITNDFKYWGDATLTNNILYNLIKNSLRAIKHADKGTISINLESGAKFNQLIFKDTATGVSKGFLPKMFQTFASDMVSEGGTGIGLAFCKMVMHSYGGDIICNSIKGKFTEIILKFPS